MRTRYKFVGRINGRYYWQAPIPGDSRVNEVSCPVAWFWDQRNNQPWRYQTLGRDSS